MNSLTEGSWVDCRNRRRPGKVITVDERARTFDALFLPSSGEGILHHECDIPFSDVNQVILQRLTTVELEEAFKNAKK